MKLNDKIKLIPTNFNDVLLFETTSYKDDRGSFKETFNNEIRELTNIDFIQDNESYSKYGVLRGLHFQKSPCEQSKLVRVSYGMIQDVVVDIRPISRTYRKWKSFELSSDNNYNLLIPKGFAHGFLVLSKEAVVNYKVDNYYDSTLDSGIRYDDERLDIKWNLPSEDIILSDKDKNLPNL
jgi:dTDP-4-dehydrorhamnose 3,5-epimerase